MSTDLDLGNRKGSPYTSTEIRACFLDYFASKGHLKVPSSSLIPRNDPTVLLTTAGMQQMIPYFLGRETPPAPRLTSAQKCFRTTDIDK
ncbi:MAG TPA: alanine--tRNA ligase-related protein, partial [Ktedonobacteraceae bacterium]|nr:alanine--tRNA ligase-related protein [Ktedonobacteraceae bacterium]